MKAMILAAGFGKRMLPLTEHTPKPLLQVAGKALIEYHIEALVAAGVVDMVINTAYLGDKIQEYLGDGTRYGAHIIYSPEDEPLETLGGIQHALHLLGDEAFVLVNGDVYCEVDFKALRHAFEQSASDGYLLLVNNPSFNSKGDFALESGLLSNATDLPRYTFAGVSILTPALIRQAEANAGPLAPLLRQAADAKHLAAGIFDGHWFDVGTPARLAEVNDFVAAQSV